VPAMPRTRRPRLSLLAAAVAGTLAVAPLLHVPRAPRPARATAPAALLPTRAAPLEVPEPPTWPLLAAGLAALGGALALRRRRGA
jgi:hypothetical protein